VTLSYHEAGRLLDAQEQVDHVPLPGAVRDWVLACADHHYGPEHQQRGEKATRQACAHPSHAVCALFLSNQVVLHQIAVIIDCRRPPKRVREPKSAIAGEPVRPWTKRQNSARIRGI
jgi:hypothetical protein